MTFSRLLGYFMGVSVLLVAGLMPGALRAHGPRGPHGPHVSQPADSLPASTVFESPDADDSEANEATTFRFPRREEFFLPIRTMCAAGWANNKLDIYRFDVLQLTDSFEVVLHDPSSNRPFTFPLQGDRSSGFGPRNLFGHRFHYGVDIVAKPNEPVVAAMPGVVRLVGNDPGGYGLYVVIAHENGLESLYGHLNRITTRSGAWVRSGQEIGLAGNTGMSTGTHLHFEFRFLGEQFDPARVLDLDRYKVKQWRFHIKPGYFLHLAEMRDQPLFYTARKGDQLQRVAALFSLPLAKLLKLNKLDAAAALTEGQRVRVW